MADQLVMDASPAVSTSTPPHLRHTPTLGPEKISEPPPIFDLPEAPTFYPTDAEFADPLAYIRSIRHIGEQAGICKIIPPKSFRPPFSVDQEHFRFRTRKQRMNSLEGKTRTRSTYLESLSAYWDNLGKPFKTPVLDRRPVDLHTLRSELARRGGFQVVTDTKQWADVGRVMGYSRETCTSLSFTLKNIYTKLIEPFEMYLECTKADVQRSTRPQKAAYRSTAAAEPAAKPTKPVPGEEICELCRLGTDPDKMLLCDNCNRGYHMTCFKPAITTVPKGNWYCPHCLIRPDDDFGFEDGHVYKLPEFRRIADDFKRKHFGRVDVSENDVEREFWRLAETLFENVEVEYGADIHTSKTGSGFPSMERNPLDPHTTCGWNLSNLPVLSESLFRYIRRDISGMMIPWLYVGMCFSTFCWHNEDHYTYSINYNHIGDTKTWYGIPASDAIAFENAMRAAVPDLFEAQPDLLFQLVTMLSPAKLLEAKVKVVRLHQRAGEFVVTFPQAYHAGFNQGFNCAEAVNFAPLDWLPFGRACVERYREFHKAPVFSHEELVWNILHKDRSTSTAALLAAELAEMRDAEVIARQRLLSRGVEVEDDDLPADNDDASCAVCSAIPFFSRVFNTQTKLSACHLHAADIAGEDDVALLSLRVRISVDELNRFVDDVKRRADEPLNWARKFEALMRDNARPPLRALQSFVADAERLGIATADARYLKEFVAMATQLVERVVRICSRKTKKRHVGADGSAAADPRPTLGEIEALMQSAARLAFEAPELHDLELLAKGVVAFQERARALLERPADEVDLDALKEVRSQGESLDIAVPELDDLARRIDQVIWVEKAMRAMHDHGNYDGALQLLAEADALGLTAAESEERRALGERVAAATAWNEQAESTAAQPPGRVSLDHYRELVERGRALPVRRDLLQTLGKALQQVERWLAMAERVLVPSRAAAKEDAAARVPAAATTTGPLAAAAPADAAAAASQQKRTAEEDSVIDMDADGDDSAAVGDAQQRGEDWPAAPALTLNDEPMLFLPVRPATFADVRALHEGLKALPVTFPCVHARLEEIVAKVDGWNAEGRALFRRPGQNSLFANNLYETLEHAARMSDIAGELRFNVADDPQRPIYCFCQEPESGVMVECDGCQLWFHVKCVGYNRSAGGAEGTSQKFICDICRPNPLAAHRRTARPPLQTIFQWFAFGLVLPVAPRELALVHRILVGAFRWRKAALALLAQSDPPATTHQLWQLIRNGELLEVTVPESALLRGRLATAAADTWRAQAREALARNDMRLVKELLKSESVVEPELGALRLFVRIDSVNRWHEKLPEVLERLDVRSLQEYLMKGKRLQVEHPFLDVLLQRIADLDAAAAAQTRLMRNLLGHAMHTAPPPPVAADAADRALPPPAAVASPQPSAASKRPAPAGGSASKRARSLPAVYCVCRSSDSSRPMIQCDVCSEWYHMGCVGVHEEAAQNIAEYRCARCFTRPAIPAAVVEQQTMLEQLRQRRQAAGDPRGLLEREDAFDRPPAQLTT